MEGEEGSGIRLSKRFSGGKVTGTGVAEVDYKTKAGTAWSHNFLNQKPWHPLSYPNQRRKWIAEQVHAQRERRTEEVAREYQQEQDFFKQAALISKKDREKVEIMKAVSFMYVRPPGYNPESAKEAEIADERKTEGQTSQSVPPDEASDARPSESLNEKEGIGEERKKRRPKDVFGRTVPTEEEFEVLKNAPRLETGVAGRARPFAVEVRNVKCLRCGNYGHQSGDRECALKDIIMPNEEVRLKRDDPLTAIIAHTDPTEPLKWELKQKPGLSPPRGGFNPDDPNQQIVAEDIFDEYGGFLGDTVPELLMNFNPDEPKKKKSKRSKKHKKRSSRTYEDDVSSSDSEAREKSSKRKKNKKKKKQNDSGSYSSEDSDVDGYRKNIRNKDLDQSETFKKSEHYHRGNSSRRKHTHSSEKDNERKRNSEKDTEYSGRRRTKHSYSSEDDNEKKRSIETDRGKAEKKRTKNTFSSDEFYVESGKGERSIVKPSVSSEGSDSSRDRRTKKRRPKHACSSEYDNEKPRNRRKSLDDPSVSSDDSDSSRNRRSSKRRTKHSDSSEDDSRSQKRKNRNSHTTNDLDSERKHTSEETKQKKSCKTSYDSESEKHYQSEKTKHKDYCPSVTFSDRYGGSEKTTIESHHRNRKRKDKHYHSSEDETRRRRNDSQRR